MMAKKVQFGGSVMKTEQKPKITSKSIFERTVTQKRVEDFYKKLNMPLGLYIPVGEFKVFENINVTESSNAGV